MPSKGVKHRHSKRKTTRNLFLLTRGREGGVVPVSTTWRCVCGYEAKNARGLAIHKGRKGHGVANPNPTLDKLDELIDSVKGGKPDLLLLSQRTRRQLTALSRATGSGVYEDCPLLRLRYPIEPAEIPHPPDILGEKEAEEDEVEAWKHVAEDLIGRLPRNEELFSLLKLNGLAIILAMCEKIKKERGDD